MYSSEPSPRRSRRPSADRVQRNAAEKWAEATLGVLPLEIDVDQRSNYSERSDLPRSRRHEGMESTAASVVSQPTSVSEAQTVLHELYATMQRRQEHQPTAISAAAASLAAGGGRRSAPLFSPTPASPATPTVEQLPAHMRERLTTAFERTLTASHDYAEDGIVRGGGRSRPSLAGRRMPSSAGGDALTHAWAAPQTPPASPSPYARPSTGMALPGSFAPSSRGADASRGGGWSSGRASPPRQSGGGRLGLAHGLRTSAGGAPYSAAGPYSARSSSHAPTGHLGHLAAGGGPAGGQRPPAYPPLRHIYDRAYETAATPAPSLYAAAPPASAASAAAAHHAAADTGPFASSLHAAAGGHLGYSSDVFYRALPSSMADTYYAQREEAARLLAVYTEYLRAILSAWHCHASEYAATLRSISLPLPFHCPSTALPLPFHCPSTALPLPFHCPSDALLLPFRCPSTDLPLTFHALPMPFHGLPSGTPRRSEPSSPSASPILLAAAASAAGAAACPRCASRPRASTSACARTRAACCARGAPRAASPSTWHTARLRRGVAASGAPPAAGCGNGAWRP